MAIDQLLNDHTLTDLLYDSDDDMALMLGAIKPWHIDGQPFSDDLEQWFEDNWSLSESLSSPLPPTHPQRP